MKQLERYCPKCKEITPHEIWNDGITEFIQCEMINCKRMEVVKKLINSKEKKKE